MNLPLKLPSNKKRTFRKMDMVEQQTDNTVLLPFLLFGIKIGNINFDFVENRIIMTSIILGRKFIALEKMTLDPANNRVSLPTSISSKNNIYQDEGDFYKRIVYE